jgi:DNA invertase Pin-like site-specific DNA recombinase/ribosomal protein L34E
VSENTGQIIDRVVGQYSQDPQTMKIERVAAYVRVSTQEQKLHGISVDAQIEKLTEYANAHNMKIVKWYKDEGISGRKLIKNRPALQEMIQDAEKRQFDRIIFIKLDRFFRSVAEYHECMKRLSVGGVIWTATEEKYDLSTPSGEAFVNMKLTMAQFEADQAGERIRMVNEYKIKSGQPLYGTQSLPLCYQVMQPEDGERHKYIAKRDEEAMRDLIAYVLQNHSVRSAMHYINQKYDRAYAYNAVMKALKNEMICGEYKGNPNYCEPYVTRAEFEMIQQIIARNPRTSTTEYQYIFTGLIVCPGCGRRLSGTQTKRKKLLKRTNSTEFYVYRGYRCHYANLQKDCSFKTIAFESRLERALLEKIESIVSDKKASIAKVRNEANRVSKYDLSALQQELDRLNYSWQKGRIKTAAEYDRRYDELMEQIDAAHEEQSSLHDAPDYEKIAHTLSGDWKGIYGQLDNEHKRAFWRSFIEEMHIQWNEGEDKKIIDIKFF